MTQHVVDDLQEYALKILSGDRASEVQSHLQTCRSCVLALGAINDLIAETIIEPMQVTPAGTLRSRILSDIGEMGPYSLYRERMAKLLLGTSTALNEELASMPHPDVWIDGPIPRCRLFPCTAAADPRDAIRTLVLMESGSHFPEHEHLGDEAVLVLQGSMLLEDGSLYRPGDVLCMPQGSVHAFDVPEGLDLVYLAVVERGIRIGDLWVMADDIA